MSYTVSLSKENFKFSASHFTVFDAHKAERLHGHNYTLEAEIFFKTSHERTELTCDFHYLKKDLRELCNFLDEYVLIADSCEFTQLKKTPEHVKITFNQKRYQLPLEDCRFLPVKNISCEALAHHFAETLHNRWNHLNAYEGLRICIQESAGQKVCYQIQVS